LHNASPPDPDNFPFLVLGNKADLDSERKVTKQKAVAWTKSKGPKALPYFETSAKDATRVEAAFLEAAQLALGQVSKEKEGGVGEGGGGGREGRERGINWSSRFTPPRIFIHTFPLTLPPPFFPFLFYSSLITHNSYFPETINLAQPTPRRGAESSACC